MSSIRIDMLGTTAGIPTPSRAHSAVHLKYKGHRSVSMLFDCGENAQRQLMKAGLNYMAIDHIFITHWHGDHSLGIRGLLDTMGFCGRERALKLYAPEERFLDSAVGRTHSMGDFPIDKHVLPHDREEMHTAFSNASFEVLSIPAEHSVPAVSFAFREKDRLKIDPEKAGRLGLPAESPVYAELREKGSVLYGSGRVDLEDVSRKVKGKKVVYSGDTEISDKLLLLAEGADLLIQDCTYFDLENGQRAHRHASFPEIVDMVREAGVGKVVLTHISRKFDDPEKLRNKLPDDGKFLLGEDFMVLEI